MLPKLSIIHKCALTVVHTVLITPKKDKFKQNKCQHIAQRRRQYRFLNLYRELHCICGMYMRMSLRIIQKYFEWFYINNASVQKMRKEMRLPLKCSTMPPGQNIVPGLVHCTWKLYQFHVDANFTIVYFLHVPIARVCMEMFLLCDLVYLFINLLNHQQIKINL